MHVDKKIATVVTMISLAIAAALLVYEVDALGAVQAGALALMVMGMLIVPSAEEHPRGPHTPDLRHLEPSTKVR